MSGIAGIIRLDGSPLSPGELEAMLAPMRRRGPDRQRSLALGNVGFAQALLATTAEATVELQPWTHRETGCVVVSDSRLDNRRDLLLDLGIRGRPVDEIGDGELLHAAYERWGEDCAKYLLGDFAFALWDPRKQLLLCARDIMGVRPLYYHHTPGRLFAFASECDAVLTVAGVPDAIDDGRVADALIGETEGIDRTSTFYSAVKRLPPARVLALRGQSAAQTEYWQPLSTCPDDLPRTDDAWADAVGDTLQVAVRCRLRGSGRVGSMLSGGLDSSSVSALADDSRRASGGARIATISAIDSQGHDDAETSAIKAMLASRDFDPILVDVADLGEIAAIVREQFRALREPFDGSMPLVSAVYAAAASSGVRCVLDGAPADNLYSVGPWHQQLARAGRLPTFWREVLAMHRGQDVTHPTLRTAQSLLGAMAPQALHRHWEASQDDRLIEELTSKAFISPDFARQTAPRERFRRMRADMQATRLHNRDWSAHSIITAAYITAGIERYSRVASHYGVEPRHPFLDRRVIELHAWLPPALRLRDGRYKWVLRHAMRDMLPPAVAWRRDKQHLGYKFSRAIWGDMVWPDHIDALPLLRHAMGVDQVRSIRRGTASALMPTREGTLIRGRALMAWACRSPTTIPEP